MKHGLTTTYSRQMWKCPQHAAGKGVRLKWSIHGGSWVPLDSRMLWSILGFQICAQLRLEWKSGMLSTWKLSIRFFLINHSYPWGGTWSPGLPWKWVTWRGPRDNWNNASEEHILNRKDYTIQPFGRPIKWQWWWQRNVISLLLLHKQVHDHPSCSRYLTPKSEPMLSQEQIIRCDISQSSLLIKYQENNLI